MKRPSGFDLLFSAAFAVFILVLEGCAPTVQLTTPEPLKVDITMTVDVNQKQVDVPKVRTIGEDEAKAMQRREQRSGEIWTLKNDGVAVEGETGYLQANPKTGWDPQYVNKLIGEENQDRHILYEAEARDDARPIKVVEEEAGKRLRAQTYLSTTNQVIKTKPLP
jgi:uncharacterized protein